MTIEIFSETAFAKINLALHVRARLDNGYHRLETLFAFGDAGDVLTAQAADSLSLSITGPFADGLAIDDSNLVMQAAQALAQIARSTKGAALTLDKRLPVASGIGGGSADAAAALRLLNRLWGLKLDHQALEDIAASLGADVPACVQSQTCRGEGVGDELAPLDGKALSRLGLLMVNPLVAVSTAGVFGHWDGLDRGALGHDRDILALARRSRNDLTIAAIKIAPQISDILDVLSVDDPLLVRMSGSGATCFALFADQKTAQAAQQCIAAKWPTYWTYACQIR